MIVTANGEIWIMPCPDNGCLPPGFAVVIGAHGAKGDTFILGKDRVRVASGKGDYTRDPLTHFVLPASEPMLTDLWTRFQTDFARHAAESQAAAVARDQAAAAAALGLGPVTSAGLPQPNATWRGRLRGCLKQMRGTK